MARKKRVKPNRRTRIKRHVLYGLVLLCVSASSLGAYHLVNAYLQEDVATIIVPLNPNVGVKAQVVEFFTANDAEEMIPIIKCESRFRHYNRNGTILNNKAGSSAIGVAQIMSSVHPDPKVLKQYNRKFNTNLTVDDFDITTIEGNLGYALMLYELRGTKDWECG